MIGIYYGAANGDPGRQKRAKDALVYVLEGLIIIMFSYAVLGVIAKWVN